MGRSTQAGRWAHVRRAAAARGALISIEGFNTTYGAGTGGGASRVLARRGVGACVPQPPTGVAGRKCPAGTKPKQVWLYRYGVHAHRWRLVGLDGWVGVGQGQAGHGRCVRLCAVCQASNKTRQ